MRYGIRPIIRPISELIAAANLTGNYSTVRLPAL